MIGDLLLGRQFSNLKEKKKKKQPVVLDQMLKWNSLWHKEFVS